MTDTEVGQVVVLDVEVGFEGVEVVDEPGTEETKDAISSRSIPHPDS